MIFLRWAAPLIAFSGGFILAAKLEPLLPISFILFFIAHVIWIYIGIKDQDKAFVTGNLLFLTLDSIGIYRWILQ